MPLDHLLDSRKIHQVYAVSDSLHNNPVTTVCVHRSYGSYARELVPLLRCRRRMGLPVQPLQAGIDEATRIRQSHLFRDFCIKLIYGLTTTIRSDSSSTWSWTSVYGR